MFLYESASRATGLVGLVLTRPLFVEEKKKTDKWFYDNIMAENFFCS